MSHPIDYARADADVVRKKFRRRVVMFVIVTVVLVVIGSAYSLLHGRSMWLIGSPMHNPPFSVETDYEWINVYAPTRTTVPRVKSPPLFNHYGNRTIGIRLTTYEGQYQEKWVFRIRYRTLFILAMIPWIITLIRLIRIWKRKRAVDVDGEL